MNMNRSGHHEMRDPEWFGRTTDRAKLSPNTLETESLGGSLNSLNLSFNTLTDDHMSVRSLPVLAASSGASIAASVDAPWNQTASLSPHSLQRRCLTPSRPPAGISALDHLENSISSLRVSAVAPPFSSIITEEEASSIHSAEDEDIENNHPPLPTATNEMDATAHAGNCRQRSAMPTTGAPMGGEPFVPRPHHVPSNYADDASYAGSSITSARSWRPRHHQTSANNTDEPSLSTLGDGIDEEDDDDDDNLSIIKLLRHQVEALKSQLLAEQAKRRAGSSQGMHHNHATTDYSSDAESFGGESDENLSACNRSDDEFASSFSKLPGAAPQNAFSQAYQGLSSAVHSMQETWSRRAASGDDDEQHLVDELVLCELDAHAKTMQREYLALQTEMQQERETWERKLADKERIIADFQRQAASL